MKPLCLSYCPFKLKYLSFSHIHDECDFILVKNDTQSMSFVCLLCMKLKMMTLRGAEGQRDMEE